MSLAADTREAVRDRPFLLDALRAGVVNYAAAAAWLTSTAGLNGDEEAIAAALRRFRDDLPAYATAEHSASVSMRSGVGVVDGPSALREDADVLLRVGTVAVTDEGDDTALLLTGDVGARTLAAALDALVAVEPHFSSPVMWVPERLQRPSTRSSPSTSPSRLRASPETRSLSWCPGETARPHCEPSRRH